MVYENLKFYTVEQVAEKLRVTEEFVMGLIENKLLEAVTLGDTGIWRVEEQAILHMLHKGNNMKGESNSVQVVNGSMDDDISVNKGCEYEEGCTVDSLAINEKEGVDMLDLNVDKYNEGDYMVVNNIKKENVIMEFVFDEEQAKKPVEDEIISKRDFYDENVHVCDDQEANEQLLRKHGMAGNV